MIQFIKTPEGGELVVLPRAEYDALLAAAREAQEDAADVVAYDSAKADFEGSAVLPAQVSAAFLKGDSLLRAWRKYRGLTQVELAERAGIAQSFLSALEARERKGSPQVLERLARELGVAGDMFGGLGAG
jgi:DNA-binding XRE family transcriptional regulator